ncbi:MAG: SBBP repeat-containing protein, partial [Chloroflexales bacterium]|nr:SBBP repeat-containing protein [Chloroflexales bacterium]
QRVPVAARFVVGAGEAVGFGLGGYDRAHPLTIDPFLLYRTVIGGGGADVGVAIAADAAGNVYVTGTTVSADLPTLTPAQPNYAGTNDTFGDAFVLKLNAAGDKLIYATYLGGGKMDIGGAIAVDGAGSAVITGVTMSDDFPLKNALQAQPGRTQGCSLSACQHAFLTKLGATGDALAFSTYLGGNGEENLGLRLSTQHGAWRDNAAGVAIDGGGNIYVGGTTYSTDFAVTAGGAFPTKPGGASQVVLFGLKLQADGAKVLYGTYYGTGQGSNYAGGIATDGAGGMYLGGATNDSARQLPLKNAFQPVPSTAQVHAIVARFNTNASGAASFVYGSYLGGGKSNLGAGEVDISANYALSIQADAAGNAYVGGHTTSREFPTRNAFQAANGADGAFLRDAFVAKINTNASGDGSLLYSSYLGGRNDDGIYGLALGPQGDVFVAGNTALVGERDFPAKDPWASFAGLGPLAFVARLDLSKAGADSLVYSSGLDGQDVTVSFSGVAVDGANNAYVVGYGSEGRELGPATSGDALVLKFSPQSTRRVYLPLVTR